MVSRCLLMLCLLASASFLQEVTSRPYPEEELEVNDIIGKDIPEEDMEDLSDDESSGKEFNEGYSDDNEGMNVDAEKLENRDDEIILDHAGGMGGIRKEREVEYVSEDGDKAIEEEDEVIEDMAEEEEADDEGETHDGEIEDDIKVDENLIENFAEEVEGLEKEMEEEEKENSEKEDEAEEDDVEESQGAEEAFGDADAEDSDGNHSEENSEEEKKDYDNVHEEGNIKFEGNGEGHGEEGHGGLDGSEGYGLPKRFYYKVKHFLKGIFSG